MNKKGKVLIILMLLSNTIVVFTPTINIVGASQYEIDGDTVFINDSYVYLSATPHTVYESGWVVMNFTSKVYTGDIDFCFGFNSTFMNPKSPQRWNGEEWVNWIGSWDTVEYDFENMTTWKYLTNIPIVQDVDYAIRCWMEMQFNTSGKYFLALKPSSETIQEAITNGHFYYLDPWWDTAWSYYKRLPVNNACNNYTMRINISYADPPSAWQHIGLNNNSQVDFEDIRFLDPNNVTVLPHFIERKLNSNWCIAWINTSSNITTSREVLIYYGNPGAANTSNSGTTFFDWIDDDSGWSDNTYLSMDETPNGNLVWNVTDNGSPYTDHDIYTNGETHIAVEMGYEQKGNWGDQYFGWNVHDDASNIFTRLWELDPAPNAYMYASSSDKTLRTPYDGEDIPRIASVDIRRGATNRYNYRLCDWNFTTLNSDTDEVFSDGSPSTFNYLRLRGYNNYEANVTIYWIRVRKYNSTAPTWGTAGTEQNVSTVQITDYYPSSGATNVELTPTFNVTVSSLNGSGMNISWYCNSSGSWVLFGFNGSATGVANGTYNQSGTNITLNSTTYHWNLSIYDGYNTLNSPIYSFSTQDTNIPRNPTNISTTFWGGTLNITWTSATNADATVVVRNNNSYPTSPTDGWERYNGSNAWYNDTSVTGTCYFRLYSWNNTNAGNFSGGVNAPWGGLGLNCFDERNNTAIGFDIEITNDDATQTFNDTGLSNTHYLSQDDIPYGTNTVFIVNSEDWGGYNERIYYHDLVLNTFYNLSFYLTYNTTEVHLYYLRVIDEVDTPIADANVNVSVNVGGSYVPIAELITDSNGYASLYLNSSRTYQVNINASGYQDESTKWYPDPDYYGIFYPKIFVMQYADITPIEPEVPVEEITFNGYINSTDVLFLNYSDAMDMTLNTQIRVYEINTSTGTETLFATFSRLTNDTYQVSRSINASNTYIVYLHMNHSWFGYQRQTLVFNRRNTTLTNETQFNAIFNAVYGSNPIGWHNFVMWIFLLAGFMYADQKDAGFVLILIGAISLFIGLFVGFNTTIATFANGILPAVFVVMGIFMLWNEGKKSEG